MLRTVNDNILLNGDMSGDLNSSSQSLENFLGFSIQATFTGAPVGTLKLQGSNDFGNPGGELGPSLVSITNWVDVKDSSQAIAAAGGVTWNIEYAFYRWVRLVYTRTSGTGTLNVVFNAKGF